MNIKFFVCACMLTALTACATPIAQKGSLGYSDKRNIVVVGENVEESIAEYYQKKYDALVWFTPYQGSVANFTNNIVESGIGPSKPMRSLIVQLKSMNQTMGRWQVYIPKIAESYFIRTLKHMENGSLSKARGSVILIDSNHAPEVEKEVNRVSDGSFFVEFESGKE